MKSSVRLWSTSPAWLVVTPDLLLCGKQEGASNQATWFDRFVETERAWGTFRKRIAEEKQKFLYEYDFGDGWEHQIVVEKILPPEPGRQYPVCVTGKRACPPEEVGGIRGYADFLKAIGDPGREEHDQVLRWVGGEFDPEAFSCEAVNATLDAVSRKRRSRK